MTKSYSKLSKRAKQIVSKYPFLEYLATDVEGPIRFRKAWKSDIRNLVQRLISIKEIEYRYYEDLQAEGQEYAVLITNLKVDFLPELSQVVIYEIKEEIEMKDFYLRLSVVPAYIGEGEDKTPWNSWCNGYKVVSEQEFRNQELVDMSDTGLGFCSSDNDAVMSEELERDENQACDSVAFIDGHDGNPVAIYVKVSEAVLSNLNQLLKDTEGKVYVAYTV